MRSSHKHRREAHGIKLPGTVYIMELRGQGGCRLGRCLKTRARGEGGRVGSWPTSADHPHQKNFPQKKLQCTQGARNWRLNLGTPFFLGPLTPPPPRGDGVRHTTPLCWQWLSVAA